MMANNDVYEELRGLGIDALVALEIVQICPERAREGMDIVRPLPYRNWFNPKGYVLCYVQNIAPSTEWLYDAFEQTKEDETKND